MNNEAGQLRERVDPVLRDASPSSEMDRLRPMVQGALQHARELDYLLFQHLPGLLAQAGQGSLEPIIQDVRDKAEEHGRAVEVAKREIEQLQADARHVLEELRDSAASVTVSSFSTLFEQGAKAADRSSLRWLWVTVALGLLTLIAGGFALLTVYFPGLGGTVPQGASVQVLAAKLVVAAILSGGTYWCGRNYRALRHQYAVHVHRDTALRTFRAFREGAEEPEVRAAVLLEAARCIFAPAATGFAPSGGDDGSPGMGEVVRALAQSRS